MIATLDRTKVPRSIPEALGGRQLVELLAQARVEEAAVVVEPGYLGKANAIDRLDDRFARRNIDDVQHPDLAATHLKRVGQGAPVG